MLVILAQFIRDPVAQKWDLESYHGNLFCGVSLPQTRLTSRIFLISSFISVSRRHKRKPTVIPLSTTYYHIRLYPLSLSKILLSFVSINADEWLSMTLQSLYNLLHNLQFPIDYIGYTSLINTYCKYTSCYFIE